MLTQNQWTLWFDKLGLEHVEKKFGEFIKLTLADCITDIVDNRGRNPEYYVEYSEHPILDNYLIKNTIHPEMTNANRYLDDKLFKTFLRDYLKKDMVVMTLVGNGIGNVTTIDNENIAIIQNTIGFVTKPEIITDRFLYYYLLQNQQTIKNFDRGSGQPSIKKTDLLAMEVNLPPLPTQQKIAQILSSLDDKIELNNKINANLEQQAQAMFKSWFVDFEPFGGEMPAGWKEKPLYEYAEFINGTSFKEDEYGTVGVPIIKIAELKNGITDATQYFNGTKDSKYDVKDGDILFSWSGNPETSIDIFIWTLGNAILNQHTFNVKSNTNRKWFTYCLLKYFKPEFCHRAGCKQTTGLGHVTANDLKQIMFSSDEKSEINFEKLITPVMEQVYNNKIENQKLASIRDTLLPKLMNGEIEV